MFDKIKSLFATNPIVANAPKRSLTSKLRPMVQYKVATGVAEWRKALDAAKYKLNPNRKALYALYETAELDDQVLAQRRQAHMAAISAAWTLEGADETILKQPWFGTYLREAVNTEFWGHTLLELIPAPGNGRGIESILLIPRQHVRPEFQDVLIYTSDVKGIPYKGISSLIELGQPDDLGVYSAVLLPYIRKHYSDTDWSQFSERFGLPFMTVRTATTDRTELDQKEAMAKNFGSSGYAILDDQDQLDFLNPNHSGQLHLGFKDRIELADKQIAKLMNGQTGTSEAKAFVGSAEVHERVMDDFTKCRLYGIEMDINRKLLPALAAFGYPVEGATFSFVYPEPQATPEAGKEPVGKKKA
jgi:Protein of unknown function (DUF935)